jgi:Transposase DDE domain
VQRRSKLNAAVFVQALVLGCLRRGETTLTDFAQICAELGVEITPQGIDDRIQASAVKLLSALFQQSLQVFQAPSTLPSAVLRQFNGIHLLDSTQIALPDAMQTMFAGCGGDGAVSAVKAQLDFNYQTGTMTALELGAGRTPDQGCDLPVRVAEVGSLHLEDLGYFKVAYFAALAAKQAFFVSRLLTSTAVYVHPDDLSALDLLTLAQSMTAQSMEVPVFLGQVVRLPIRLILVRLSPQQVAVRRRKALAKAKQHGRTPSARHLALLEFSFFITNVPPERLTTEQVPLLYALRWQIELIFKLWKSQAKLARLGNWRADRVLCQLFARLLGLVLFHWLVAPVRFLDNLELSLPKAFSIFQGFISRLVDALPQGIDALAVLLSRLGRHWQQFATKNRRRKHPSSYQRFQRSSLA